MNYITDYQLDIDRGFQCKVNGKLFEIYFSKSADDKHWFITDQFRKLLIKLELNPDVAVRPYGKFEANHLCYCDSKQQCYDLCQSVVAAYFKPTEVSHIKECSEKSRRHLAKYYNDDQSIVAINGKQWNLIWDQSRNVWWYHHRELGVSKYWECFGFNHKSVIDLCSYLGISAKYTNKLEFDSRQDAIKFTDYLIETYIIKKEKTYDTNQLRKERTSLSRGAKPAGSIIHGRRSKASVRCGRIEHKACLGN